MKAWKLALAVGLLGLGTVAWADLIAYSAGGVDLVYDDDRDLTWVQDANLFKTQYDADNTVVDQIIAAVPTVTDGLGVHNVVAGDFDTSNGEMTWWGAMAWAEWLGLTGYGGADDWGLWSALNSDGTGPCVLFDCSDSDLGHLFYDEGGRSAGDAINDSAALTAVFANIQDFIYWSRTEYAPDPDVAWLFVTASGFQFYDERDDQFYGWAVRPGQVAAAPLPGTALLAALGLLGLGYARKRARRRPW